MNMKMRPAIRNLSKYRKMRPSPLDCLFFVIYAVGSVLAKTPTSGNNIDTSGENNSTIKDTKMLVCILLVLTTVLYYN